jgi:hypothetical protein
VAHLLEGRLYASKRLGELIRVGSSAHNGVDQQGQGIRDENTFHDDRDVPGISGGYRVTTRGPLRWDGVQLFDRC